MHDVGFVAFLASSYGSADLVARILALDGCDIRPFQLLSGGQAFVLP